MNVTRDQCPYGMDDGWGHLRGPDCTFCQQPSGRSIALSFEDAQHILDDLVGSDSAASGYLDTEGVVALRNLAKAIGVDPMTVTPSTFVDQYVHVPVLETYRPHDWIARGDDLSNREGWIWVEAFPLGSAAGQRYEGHAIGPPIERCKICATANGGTTAGADDPVHRPWVDAA